MDLLNKKNIVKYTTMDADNRKKIVIAIVAFAFFITGFFLWRGRSAKQNKDTTKEKTTVTESPEPTEEPEFKKDDFTIKILNGSGKAGLSGSLQKDLEEKGYKVEGTGNADNFNYKKTIIQTKENVPQKFIDELKDLLSDKYGSVETEELDSDGDTDVVIIIGGQQEEEKATVAPTQSSTSPTPVQSAPTPTPTTAPTVAPTATPKP